MKKVLLLTVLSMFFWSLNHVHAQGRAKTTKFEGAWAGDENATVGHELSASIYIEKQNNEYAFYFINIIGDVAYDYDNFEEIIAYGKLRRDEISLGVDSTFKYRNDGTLLWMEKGYVYKPMNDPREVFKLAQEALEKEDYVALGELFADPFLDFPAMFDKTLTRRFNFSIATHSVVYLEFIFNPSMKKDFLNSTLFDFKKWERSSYSKNTNRLVGPWEYISSACYYSEERPENFFVISIVDNAYKIYRVTAKNYNVFKQ